LVDCLLSCDSATAWLATSVSILEINREVTLFRAPRKTANYESLRRTAEQVLSRETVSILCIE